MTQIPNTVTAGTFSDTSTNADGQPVPDTYQFSSDIDASIGVVNPDGSATFTGTPGTFTVTATDPLGLQGSDQFEIVDLKPAAVGAPTFAAA